MKSPKTNKSKPNASKSAKAPVSRRKRWTQNLVLLIFSSLLAFFVGELALRWAIFNGGPGFKNLQNPGNYYYEWDEDYWKLNLVVDTTSRPPRNPHPTMGWVQGMDRETYYHQNAKHLGRRRPVLLYGDSFSMCIDSVDCFDEILNADTVFSQDNYLLNYGIGGYGVCQASLLCRKTAPHYEKPLVVFGILTTDLDRTILPVRTGQKPYYDVEDSTLTLKGYPIDTSAMHYYAEHPRATTSFLFRWFLKSKLNFLPYRFSIWFDGKEKSKDKIRLVNRLLIEHLVAELRMQGIDFVFLIFHFEDDMMAATSEDNWRDQFLKQTLADNQIPYIWSKGIIREHRKAHPENTHERYVIPGNGHPTSLYNQLISDEIKRIALAQPRPADFQPDTLNDELYATRIWQRMKAIRSDSASMQEILAKAAANAIPIDSQTYLDANYLMNLELKNKRPFKPDGIFEGKWREK